MPRSLETANRSRDSSTIVRISACNVRGRSKLALLRSGRPKRDQVVVRRHGWCRLVRTSCLVITHIRLFIYAYFRIHTPLLHFSYSHIISSYSSFIRSFISLFVILLSISSSRSSIRSYASLPNTLLRLGTYSFAVLLTGAAAGYLFGRQTPAPLPTTSTAPLASTTPPSHNTAPTNLEAAWTDFRDIVGEENITTEPSELASHSGSEWSSHPSLPGDRPFCVVRPASTEDVSEIMKICHRRRIPVTAYSGGTSLEGHFAATRGGICIDFSRMDKILKLHKDDLDVVVQPAVGWESLNEELADQGLFFPPDPGPGAMIGGMVGTGCSGTNAYRYGTMKEWVLGLTVVLADGTIVKTKQRPRKSSAGYDLTRVFVGSEGTLGLVTEATLKVTVKPQNTSVAVCTFGTVREAANAVFKVVGEGVPIAAIELLDDVQMRCINDAGQTSRSWKEAPTLFFKFSGTPAGVKEQISIVQRLAKGSGSRSFEFAKTKDEADELWSARKEALWSVMAKRKADGDHVWTTDVAVPISRLPDIVEETKDAVSKSGLTGAIVGHVGDGNFHSKHFHHVHKALSIVPQTDTF